MLTSWLVSLVLLTALLTGRAFPGRQQRPLEVKPTTMIKGPAGAEMTLNCGHEGVVAYWHTPFGDLQSAENHSNLGPVLIRHDGGLLIINASCFHSGLYYCLLKGREGTTLWPYQLHVDQSSPCIQQHTGALLFGLNPSSPQAGQSISLGGRDSRSAVRPRRDPGGVVGSGKEEQAGVLDSQLSAAVAASVVLTFVVGFTAGALSRVHVLRCFGAATDRVRARWQQGCRTNTSDHVTMTTIPPTCNNSGSDLRSEPESGEDSVTLDTSTTSSPPMKPQRSFKLKQGEEVEITAYLEGCDFIKEEGGRREEEVEREKNGVCLSEDGISESERLTKQKTDKERCSEERGMTELGWRKEDEEEERSEEAEAQKEGGRESSMREKGLREEDDKTGTEKQGKRQNEEAAKKGSKEKNRRDDEDEEKRKTNRGEKDGGEPAGREKSSKETGEIDSSDSERLSPERDEEGTDSDKDKEGIKNRNKGGEQEEVHSASTPHPPARRSRVIRLYQYDEDGNRYGHLPDPGPDEPGPAPRLKQRSLSLTRLNAIMATASAGPMDNPMRENREEREGKAFFHMEI